MTAEMSVRRPTLCVEVWGPRITSSLLTARGESKSDRHSTRVQRASHPDKVLDAIVQLASKYKNFERVAVGFPGVVREGIITRSPLGSAWKDYPLSRQLQVKLECLVKVASVFDIKGLSVIEGEGVELVLTLDAEFGSALFLDGRMVPNFSLGPHPFRKKHSYEDYVGAAALKAVGVKAWSKRVLRTLDLVGPMLNPRMIYLTGAHAKRLKTDLPPGVSIVQSPASFLGSDRLWD